jgi:hypothetical protein
MTARKDDRQKVLEDKLEEQIGGAEPEPQTDHRPVGVSININGGVFGDGTVIGGTNTTTIINLSQLVYQPTLIINLIDDPSYREAGDLRGLFGFRQKTGVNSGKNIRQIKRKFSDSWLNLLQITRKPKISRYATQPQ